MKSEIIKIEMKKIKHKINNNNEHLSNKIYLSIYKANTLFYKPGFPHHGPQWKWSHHQTRSEGNPLQVCYANEEGRIYKALENVRTSISITCMLVSSCP